MFLRTLAAVPGRRSVVDYSLQRRAVLADVYAGRAGLFEVCDASPYLSRAAKYHGEVTDVACPVCRKERLTRVNYVYGDHLGPTSGQAKTEAELARMDAMQEEFTVYEVEVCRQLRLEPPGRVLRHGCRARPGAPAPAEPAPGGHRIDAGEVRLRRGDTAEALCRRAVGLPRSHT